MIRTIWATGIGIMSAGTAIAQGYVGDVAIQEDDMELGERHYSPFIDQAYPDRLFSGGTRRW